MKTLGTALCLILAGCQSHPTESDARKWFSELRPTISAMEKRVLDAMEDFPYANRQLTCEEVIAADPLKGLLEGAGPKDVELSIRCTNATNRWYERAIKNEEAFHARVGRVLLDGNRVSGVRIRITRTKPLNPNIAGALGGSLASEIATEFGVWTAGCGHVTLAGKAGYVTPENGINVDGYSLGWGLANLSLTTSEGSYQNRDYYPSLYVLWMVPLSAVNLEIRMALQPTADVPAEYLELEKRSCR